VADAALVLGALTGVDPRDPATAASAGRAQTDYTPFLNRDGLRGARLGVVRNLMGSDARVDAIVEESLELMRQLGAEILDPVNVETSEKFRETEFEVLLYEFKADLNQYLAGLGPEAPVHSLAEIIAFNERERDRVMPYFGQELLVQSEAKGPLTEEAYLKALETNHRLARAEGLDAALQANQLDALVAPTGGPAWLTDWVNGDHSGSGSSSLAAVAGYPNITVPAGFVFGLPVGISFFGGPYEEGTLLRLAYAYEQARQARRAPDYLPNVKLG